ncbi:MAG: NAD(P)-dependent oxidoreductase [Ancalomicrobiaceae bacterium]|nr:NAD(P)-dependent oxidoreductase [Ancalomicrobiaceae bacterium]
MRLLITGATGFVGAATVRRALETGDEVAVLIRDPARPSRLTPQLPQVAMFVADLRDAVAVGTALAAFRPEAVLHLAWAGVSGAARNDPSQVYDNLVPTVRLVDLSARHGVGKFVGLGSQGEYGPLDTVISETDRPQPTTLYGTSKLATALISERMAALSGQQFAWLRLFSTYGPGDSEIWMIPSIIGQLLRGERPKTTAGTQLWDYLYIDDVADGILAATRSEAAVGVFNLGSGKPVAVRWIIETIRDLIDPDADIGFGEVPFRPDQVMHMEADITRLTSLTGWEPKVDFRDGLQRTVAAMRERAHD